MMTEQWLPLLLDFLLGGALGFIGGLFGIGGGLLAIPILAIGFGLDQQVAQGTALVMMTPNMTIGFWRYRQRNPITLKMGAMLGVGSMLASYLAAIAVAQIANQTLRNLFAVFIFGLACNMLWRGFGPVRQPKPRRPLSQKFLPVVGLLGGTCSGFFTIGGGVVSVPILTTFFGFTQTSAQGLALAMLVPGSLVALLTYAHLGLVNWTVAIPMTLGSMLTVSYGVTVAHRLPERRLRGAFALVLALAAGFMLAR